MFLANEKRINKARSVFDKMSEKNVVSWTQGLGQIILHFQPRLLICTRNAELLARHFALSDQCQGKT